MDFRNIPQFLGNKEIWETLITAYRIVYPNTNITNRKTIQKSTMCALNSIWDCFYCGFVSGFGNFFAI